MDVIELIDKFPTDDHCRAHLEAIRWPNGPVCPRCGHSHITRLAKRRQFTCQSKACRYRFSVTVDTVMHASKLPLRKWFIAIALIADAKKGMSSLQVRRHLKISKECAWHMVMRIREAMREDAKQAELFRGVVQADEYFHGRVRRARNTPGGKPARGRGTPNIPVIGIYENQSGRIRTQVVKDASRNSLAPVIYNRVDVTDTELHTDKWPSYNSVGRLCKLHRRVDHGRGEYVSADGAHTNGIENAWSLFARSVMGSFHKVSAKHLPRYLHEFDSRFNARRLNGQYFGQVLGQSFGRRLPYTELVNRV